MKLLKKIPLLAWIVIAILAGVLIGATTPGMIGGINSGLGISIPTDVVVQIFVSFSTVFSAFLSFSIPLIIIGFIVPGIGSLAQGAGKMLGITVALSYLSSIVAGFLALTAALFLYPILLKGQRLESFDNPENALSTGYIKFELDPIMGVMSALILSFILGLGITALKTRSMLNLFEDFQVIIEKLLSYVIIPLLPIHIVGVFANMTLAGQVAKILSVFGMVFIMVIMRYHPPFGFYDHDYFMCSRSPVYDWAKPQFCLGNSSSAYARHYDGRGPGRTRRRRDDRHWAAGVDAWFQ